MWSEQELGTSCYGRTDCHNTDNAKSDCELSLGYSSVEEENQRFAFMSSCFSWLLLAILTW